MVTTEVAGNSRTAPLLGAESVTWKVRSPVAVDALIGTTIDRCVSPGGKVSVPLVAV